MIRIKIYIDGIVQGVGFRPHIFRMASQYTLKGYVINTSSGVEIDIEGEEVQVYAFVKELSDGHNLPPLSRVLSLRTEGQKIKGYKDFRILESLKEEGRITLISPDISTCNECLQELNDPEDRRYLYPFINCTNCGPRYTITRSLPYDRENTVMSKFKMCDRCFEEYHDPLNRRFHAQPDACFQCGPQVQLCDSQGKEIQKERAIEETIRLLEKGFIIAIKGVGGFHLAVDASNEESISILRDYKGREEKPLALMVRDIETAEKFCIISEMEKHFLLSPQRPIVLVEKRGTGIIAPNAAPRNRYFGIFLPYTPLHYLLMKGAYPALIMTSANISEEPLCKDNEEALNRMKGIASFFLFHDRDIYQRCDDSVISIVNKIPIVIRRARGYAPEPVIMPVAILDALATGAHLKNTICLGKDNRAFLSQHIGDLETYETLKFFEATIQHLVKIFNIKPGIIVHDKHPGYLSTVWALQQELPHLAVQHHEAHVASCMAEHHLNEAVIGVSFDGTGYGLDGRIWGSEFFIGKPGNFKRKAHFDYVEMPGGDMAAREPWRMTIAYLYKYFDKAWLEYSLPFISAVGIKKIKNVMQLIDSRINCTESSGCGRLFDAVASLIGLQYMNKYEGQAPMELEMLIDSYRENEVISECYKFDIKESNDQMVISFAPMLSFMIEDVLSGVSNGTISEKFHNTLVQSIVEICNRLRAIHNINNVVMSGGCFQNRFLLNHTVKRLKEKHFNVYYHQQVPPNDAGISLGQIYTCACIQNFNPEYLNKG